MAENTGVSFPVLYDPAAEVVRRFRVFNLTGDGLATPSTFVIDGDGVIRWKYVGRGASDRPPADVVLQQVAALAG